MAYSFYAIFPSTPFTMVNRVPLVTFVVVSRAAKEHCLDTPSADMWNTSTTSADATKSELVTHIPGIGDATTTNMNLTESAADEHDHIRYTRASRLINRQFMVNWTTAMHTYIPCLMPGTVLANLKHLGEQQMGFIGELSFLSIQMANLFNI